MAADDMVRILVLISIQSICVTNVQNLPSGRVLLALLDVEIHILLEDGLRNGPNKAVPLAE